MPANETDSAARGAQSNGAVPASRAALRGLDLLNLFVANIQTGFGPFIAVYLTTRGWTETSIGIALSLGTLTAMASQLPAGALVDAVRNKASVGFFSILAFSLCALLFAIWPVPLSVYLAEVLHGFSSCTLGPVIAAISLAIAGPRTLGLRLGRNARFASIGNGVGAALMGAVGFYLPVQSIFYLTAVLTLPAFAALAPLRGIGDAPAGRAEPRGPKRRRRWKEVAKVLGDRRLLIFALCAALFTFSNAAMLPLAGSSLTKRGGSEAALLIAAAIVLPQAVMALLSPTVGTLAERRGRRLMLIVGFFTLPVRGLFFAVTANPIALVSVQLLDGIASACFGVLLPLVIADIAGRSGHFNLALGFVGFTIGIGATASTAFAGWVSDHVGEPFAFAGLAYAGLAAALILWALMPETQPARPPDADHAKESKAGRA